MLIEIDGRRYPVKRMEDLELRHVAQLQYELGSGDLDGITSMRTLEDIKQALGRWGTLDRAEQERHPDALFLTCFTVWAARRLAGESATLMESISIPATSMRIITEPGDKAGGGQGKAQGRRPNGSVGGARPAKRKAKRR